MRGQIRATLPVLLVLLAGAGAVRGEGWEFSVAAYGWGAELDDLDEPCPPPCTAFSTDPVDYGDTGDPTGGDFLGRFAASKGRWRVFVAAAKSSGDWANSQDEIANELATLELGAGYGLSPSFELLFGARRGDGHMDWARAFIRGIVFTGRNNYDYVEPFVGGAWSFSRGERWTLGAQADVGGFGIGSERSWHAEAEMRFEPAERWALALGYRIVEVEVEQEGANDFFLEFGFPGVLAGVVFRFP